MGDAGALVGELALTQILLVFATTYFWARSQVRLIMSARQTHLIRLADGRDSFSHPLDRYQGGKKPWERAKAKKTGAELEVCRGVLIQRDRCLWSLGWNDLIMWLWQLAGCLHLREPLEQWADFMESLCQNEPH